MSGLKFATTLTGACLVAYGLTYSDSLYAMYDMIYNDPLIMSLGVSRGAYPTNLVENVRTLTTVVGGVSGLITLILATKDVSKQE